jgi:hypothetical protein
LIGYFSIFHCKVGYKQLKLNEIKIYFEDNKEIKERGKEGKRERDKYGRVSFIYISKNTMKVPVKLFNTKNL